MGRKLDSQDEIITAMSDMSGYTKSSIKEFMSMFSAFLENCIEEGIEFRYSGCIELYYSDMKERDTIKVGTKDERITLPPVRKAKIRLSQKLREKQTLQNKTLRPVLEEMHRDYNLEENETD